MDAVRTLLPGPTPAAIRQVAGLLEGPGASDAEAQVAANLKQLAQIMRNASAEAEQRREQERQRQRQERLQRTSTTKR